MTLGEGSLDGRLIGSGASGGGVRITIPGASEGIGRFVGRGNGRRTALGEGDGVTVGRGAGLAGRLAGLGVCFAAGDGVWAGLVRFGVSLIDTEKRNRPSWGSRLTFNSD